MALALTVRGGRAANMMAASGGGPNGTVLNPNWVEVGLQQIDPPLIKLQTQLGYERIPSTQVFGFKASKRFELQINRRSTDPYIVHVQITVYRIGERRSVYAITTASGRGDLIELPAGDYRIICALGIPEQVDLELELLVRPAPTYISNATADGRGSAILSGQGARLPLAIIASGKGEAFFKPVANRPRLAAVAVGCSKAWIVRRDYQIAEGLVAEGNSKAWIDRRDYQIAEGLVAEGSSAALIQQSAVEHWAIAGGAGTATAAVAPFEWVAGGPSEPCTDSWTVQVVDGVVQWNSDNPPSSTDEVIQALLGVDGGDFEQGQAWSYPPRCADGGDFDQGAPILYPLPQQADGGDFDQANTLSRS
jgi:hypothetical protein